MTTETFKVAGMTCGHCVSAVKGEVTKIDGVTDVEVDLESGDVIVVSDRGVEDAIFRAAIDEAGYEIAT